MNIKQAYDYIENQCIYGHGDDEDYIERVLALLGNPQNSLKIIHIAGTNGKGSVGFFLYNILYKSGIATGHFSSPHLVSYEERIKVDGKEISTYDLIKSVESLKSTFENNKHLNLRKPTYFEMSLLLAIIYFSYIGCEYVVLETGIGGRMDATNHLGNTVLSIITTVGLDHTSQLGSTIEEIAYHKAGIIKDNVPTVTMEHEENIDIVIKNEAIARNSDITWIKPDDITILDSDISGSSFEIKNIDGVFHISMIGDHQVKNATLAIVSAKILGININEIIERKSIDQIQFEGRMEVLRTEPLVIVDGAHNAEGLETLYSNIKDWENIILIYGVMSDKDVEDSSIRLFDLAKKIVFTGSSSERKLDPEELRNHYIKYSNKSIYYKDLESAIDNTILESESSDIIIVTGSLYLVGDAKAVFMEE